MAARKHVDIFTDGACSGNPGPGGYGAILRHDGREKELTGGARDTTNNRMELSAVIAALEALKEPCDVTLYSDSRYIVDAITKHWLENWQKKGWIRGRNEPVLNRDLWEKLLALLNVHSVTFEWVKGHAEHPENERCDKLATTSAQNYK